MLEVNVLTPQEYEQQCKQPIAIASALLMLVMASINMVSMFAMFTKLEKLFNPHRLATKVRQHKFKNQVHQRLA
jgi:hypothetical protein